MTEATVTTLLLIAVAAALSPVLAEATGRVGVPDVVIQLGFGILIGPAVLAVAHTDGVITSLSDMGLSFLMFLAGYEIDFSKVKGRPLGRAVVGWALSVALAMAAAFALVSSGLALDTLIVGLALSTTALGTLLPVLRDAGLTERRFGSYILAAGTVGEFGPIVAVAVLLDRRDPRVTAALLAAFMVVAVTLTLVAARPRPPRVVRVMRRQLNSSAQLPIRVAIVMILGLISLAFRLGVDVLLGAFAAGVVVSLFVEHDDREAVSSKLEAIGFGFFVPIFFIVSGMRFDLHALEHTATLLRLPLFLGLFFLVRGTPALVLYRRDLARGERLPLALLSATGLPLIVVITSIGLSENRMLPRNAAALVGAGMLSVLLYPLLARALLTRAARTTAFPDPSSSESSSEAPGATPAAPSPPASAPDPSSGVQPAISDD